MTVKDILYCGHSAVFINTEDKCIAVDPWLTGNPACPEKLQNPDRLDVVVLTHGHSDHAGDAVRLGKHYGCRIAATYELAMIMIDQGVPEMNVIPMNKGGSVEVDGITVTLTNAYHSSSYDTTDGTVYAGEACGAIISDGAKTIYHAGDTCLFSDMSLIKEMYAPDIGLIPIGDRFTMGPKEAAQAAKLVGCAVAIPIHYKTFDILTGTAEEFTAECSKIGIECAALNPGESYTL